jgi:hypothetical protein
LVLSATNEFDELRSLLESSATPILAFASLTSIAEVAASLNVAPSRLTNLEGSLAPPSEDDDTTRFRELGMERRSETELEPHVAFGLLVQKYFDGMLPDDDRAMVRSPE